MIAVCVDERAGNGIGNINAPVEAFGSSPEVSRIQKVRYDDGTNASFALGKVPYVRLSGKNSAFQICLVWLKSEVPKVSPRRKSLSGKRDGIIPVLHL